MLLLVTEPRNAISNDLFDFSIFRERERARQNLERIQSSVAPDLLSALPPLLTESPDPDQALNLFERLSGEGNDQLFHLLDKNRVLLHHIMAIFGHSYWLGETLIHNQDIFYSLQREKNLERSLEREDFRGNFARFRSRSLETDISVLLARFRKREYVRITLRDLLGIATLAETTAEISALSDVLIEEALREAETRMRKRYGAPEYQDRQGRRAEAPFAVLSLGKLGGGELNYSSDVDLLYLYGDQETAGTLPLYEYFTRQAQLLTEILSRATSEGPVFRIDLRLRPQGNEGEPAVGLRHALNYYAHAAHDWELQALIKLRYSAGDLALARTFIREVEPHVYTRAVNFEAIETALYSRERMGAQRRRLMAARKGQDSIDVKSDRGGIRDIEFLVQCLQRVYGGEEKWLRPGGTLFSLQKLHDKGHISGKDFHDLTLAYEFLRKVEHRLQLQRAQQLHRLPSAPEALQVLHRAVEGDSAVEDPSAFLFTVKARMASVIEIYERTIHSQRQIEKGLGPFRLTPAPGATVRELSFDQALQRIALDAPSLHAVISGADLSLHSRRNLHKFLSSAMTSSERYTALLENSSAVEQALQLFDSSEYLTDILVRHPDAVRVLQRLPNAAEPLLFKVEPEELFSSVKTAHDYAEALALLRRNYRAYTFASGARDVLQARSVFEAMQDNSRIADAAICAALRLVDVQEMLAVFALGRLGTGEFDIASDADLLFVRAPQTDGDKARAAAEKLMHAVAAYTREGTLFAVDARLRPHGGEGELVITPGELERYLAEEAQPWEALTYTKLRFVAGAKTIAGSLLPMVHQQIIQMAMAPSFAQAAVEMRSRLEKSNRFMGSFKFSPGGFYDIDFLASYLALQSGLIVAESIDARLERLQDTGLLDGSSLQELRQAALLYRTLDHAIRLVTGRARPELPAAEHARQATERLASRMLQRPRSENLQAELEKSAVRVRQVFNSVFQ